MHRLFVGLRPPMAMRQHLLGIMGGVPGARWQADEQLHLTLRFIGEVERPVAEDVATALQGITHPAPTIAVQGVGTFGSKGRPHSLWAGIVADEALRTLQQRIDRAVVVTGCVPERRAFHPHITLARLGRAAGPVEPFLADHAALAVPPARIESFLLFESHLSQAGADYEAVARIPLR